MTDHEPVSGGERYVVQQHLGIIEGEAGRRSVFLARHFDEHGEEVASVASLMPIGPSFLELADQQAEAQKLDPATATQEEYDAALKRVMQGVREKAQRQQPAARPSLPRPGAAYDHRPVRDRLAFDDDDSDE